MGEVRGRKGKRGWKYNVSNNIKIVNAVTKISAVFL